MGMSSTSSGAGRKRMRFQDEIETIERRRSSRIIALEEKKQQEKERKLALALLAKKSNSTNQIDNTNKGKEKAKINAGDHLDDFNEAQKLGPTKKGCKSRTIFQLIDALKEGINTHNASTSIANVSSLNGLPGKHVLERVLDFLQRKDPDDLFGEPVNLDMVENHHLTVNEPMDFGTMRAKVHEGMYRTLQQVKRDVCLICFNALNAYPATSRYHKAAEVIGDHAITVFEGLSADLEHFDLEFSPNKRRPSKKSQKRRPRTSQLVKVSPKPTGRNNATVSKIERRAIYWPPSNKSLASEFLNANKPNIQLNKDPSKYRESLQQFVKKLGPIVQRVAAKKLEALKSQQLQNGNTLTPNLLENVSATQIIYQPTPLALTQPNTLNSAQMLSLANPLFNRPLTIPGTIGQQNRKVNTIVHNVNIRDGSNKGIKDYIKENWQTCAAAVLSLSYYHNNDTKEKMIANLKDAFDKIGQWNTFASKSNSTVFTHVHPTCVISKPRSKPLESISGKNLSKPPFIPQPRPKNTMPSINLSRLSLMSQPRPANTMSLIGDSRLSQPRPENSLSSMPSNNPTNLPLVQWPGPKFAIPTINLSELSRMCRSRLVNSMSSFNIPSSVPLLHSQDAKFSNELDTSLFGLGTPYQAGDFQAIMGSLDFNNSPYPKQVISQMNPHIPVSLQEPSSSSALEVDLRSAMNYNGGGAALVSQQEEGNSQLWGDDDQQPNLTLQLGVSRALL